MIATPTSLWNLFHKLAYLGILRLREKMVLEVTSSLSARFIETKQGKISHNYTSTSHTCETSPQEREQNRVRALYSTMFIYCTAVLLMRPHWPMSIRTNECPQRTMSLRIIGFIMRPRHILGKNVFDIWVEARCEKFLKTRRATPSKCCQLW